MAKIMVESLRRLYHDGKVPKEKINALFERCVISEDEYLYILGDIPEDTEIPAE